MVYVDDWQLCRRGDVVGHCCVEGQLILIEARRTFGIFEG